MRHLARMFWPCMVTLFLVSTVGGLLAACDNKDPKASADDAPSTLTLSTSAAPNATPTTPPASATAATSPVVDTVVGTGAEAKAGNKVTVHYTGFVVRSTGELKQFESSHDKKKPYSFRLGAGAVIQGWDDGVVGMKVGGKRRLTIPPQLAYGAAGSPPTIPGNATLVFDVELLKVEP